MSNAYKYFKFSLNILKFSLNIENDKLSNNGIFQGFKISICWVVYNKNIV